MSTPEKTRVRALLAAGDAALRLRVTGRLETARRTGSPAVRARSRRLLTRRRPAR